jgi:hypothetical protein
MNLLEHSSGIFAGNNRKVVFIFYGIGISEEDVTLER